MRPRGVVLVYLVFCSTISVIHSCIYNEREERTHCSSFDALQQAGKQPKWRKLNLINSGNEALSSIRQGVFMDTPNVLDLQVKGLANGLEEGAFNGLQNIYELHLDDNKLNVIPSWAFANLTAEVIYIYNCDVREIQPQAFQLATLKKVLLYRNNISKIEAGVFSNTNITYLFMRKNGIKEVAASAFSDMDHLSFLSLEENELTSFEPQLTIGFAPMLSHLYINRNQLSKVSRDMFATLPNLQVLLMNLNSIKRFGDSSFYDLKQLRLLDISNNQLEEIQANVFVPENLNQLQVLFIHDNRLSFLTPDLLSRLPLLSKMSVGGNPWQCTCCNTLDNYLNKNNITRLCNEEYSEGDRPVCVFSDTSLTECIYDLEKVRDLPSIYLEMIKKYPKLPPVCNIDGVIKPILGP